MTPRSRPHSRRAILRDFAERPLINEPQQTRPFLGIDTAVEYSDATHYAFLIDGKVVWRGRHGDGKVPYVHQPP